MARRSVRRLRPRLACSWTSFCPRRSASRSSRSRTSRYGESIHGRGRVVAGLLGCKQLYSDFCEGEGKKGSTASGGSERRLLPVAPAGDIALVPGQTRHVSITTNPLQRLLRAGRPGAAGRSRVRVATWAPRSAPQHVHANPVIPPSSPLRPLVIRSRSTPRRPASASSGPDRCERSGHRYAPEARRDHQQARRRVDQGNKYADARSAP